MPTVNELMADEAIRHHVALIKYSNETVRKIIAVLNRSDARLRAAILDAIEKLSEGTFSVERLESLLGSVRALNAVAYDQVRNELMADLKNFTDYEVSYQSQMLHHTLPVTVHTASVNAEQVYAAAMARPFQGLLLRDVLKDLEANRAKKIKQAIAQGFVESKTTPQIVREIMGTKANQYQDGLLDVSRREASSVVRTALSHTSGFVQDRIAEANAGLLQAVQWSATLDLRTSETCRIRDGKMYTPVTHAPIDHDLPWLGGPGRAHWNCRSVQIFVTKSLFDILGVKGSNDITLSGGTRASMDGQVPKEMNYAEWLKKQSFERQVEVLGPTRAKLLRDGNLPLERMYGVKGQFLKLDELRARDAAAFKRAGVP